jgi:hypothetical protein
MADAGMGMDIPLGGIAKDQPILAAIVAPPEMKSDAVTTYTPRALMQKRLAH